MDTSTVRLVIFIGMFLIFAGDYSTLISSIFGNATERNATDTVRGPEAQFKGPHDKIDVISKKDVDKNNGKNKKITHKRYNKTFFLHTNILLHQKKINDKESSVLC